jgi:DNA-binding transcriptional LysR family regulator
MNVQHLRTLIAIAEQGSLSAAARAMQISQPAVTKQVQRLEQELGTSLLVRGPQPRVSFTAAGERALAFAREVAGRLDVLHEQLALLRSVSLGRLTVAASTIPGEYLLPALLAAFHSQYPQVQVRSTIADTAEVARQVLAGQADVGFVGAVPGPAGLRLERLVADDVVLAVPCDHPFARRAIVGLDELAGQPLILREEGSGTRRSVEKALAAAGYALRQEDVALALGSTQAIVQAVGQGLGIGFVSARAATQAQADGHLVCVRLAGLDLRRDLYLAYMPQRLSDPVVAHFVAFTRSRLGQ